jgi:hypothetical protein
LLRISRSLLEGLFAANRADAHEGGPRCPTGECWGYTMLQRQGTSRGSLPPTRAFRFRQVRPVQAQHAVRHPGPGPCRPSSVRYSPGRIGKNHAVRQE